MNYRHVICFSACFFLLVIAFPVRAQLFFDLDQTEQHAKIKAAKWKRTHEIKSSETIDLEIKSSLPDNRSSTSSILSDYGESGRLVERVTLTSSRSSLYKYESYDTTRQRFVYDSVGLIERYEWYRGNALTEVTTYDFDEYRRPLYWRTTYVGMPDRVMEVLFSYDHQNKFRVISLGAVDSIGVRAYRATGSLNDKHRPTRIVGSDYAVDTAYIFDYEYFDDVRISKHRRQQGENIVTELYNESGDLIKFIVGSQVFNYHRRDTTIDGVKWRIEDKVEEATDNGEQSLTLYDEFGNILERKTSSPVLINRGPPYRLLFPRAKSLNSQRLTVLERH